MSSLCGRRGCGRAIIGEGREGVFEGGFDKLGAVNFHWGEFTEGGGEVFTA